MWQYNYNYPNYLAHYGVLGMKWGVHRYVDKNGKLTAEGKQHVSNYKKSESLRSNVIKESKRLINSSKRLKRDFGSETDDPEYLEIIARDYGIDTSKLSDADAAYYKFGSENKESIKTGRKIVKYMTKHY